MNQVKFVYCTQDEYDGISSKDNYSIYFTSDTYRIYRGGSQFGGGSSSGGTATGDYVTPSQLTTAIEGVEAQIPTATSDITNDSGFVTYDDLPTPFQPKQELSSGTITLQRNKVFYTKTVSSDTTFTISVPSGYTDYVVTFEIELNVTVDNLSISYPWEWIDDLLAPDLAQVGCYTIAVRGKYRNGSWTWRANLQDTEDSF